MMVQAPDWATHHIKWKGMEAFYNDKKYIGYRESRKMWAGNWTNAEQKTKWVELRCELDLARVVELLPIQENE